MASGLSYTAYALAWAGYAWMLDVLLRIIKRKAWWQHARWPVAADNPCDHPQTPVMRKAESNINVHSDLRGSSGRLRNS